MFKGFKFGKKKGTENTKQQAEKNSKQISELEEQLKDRTDSLVETEKKLEKLSGKANDQIETDVTLERPHEPIGELSIEPEDALIGVDTDEVEAEEIVVAKAEEKIPEEAQSELKPEQPMDKKDKKNPIDADSLKALFTSEEEDENPLASLINSLPDVPVDELNDDLKEIKDIIRDWQKK